MSFWKAENFPSVDLKALYSGIYQLCPPLLYSSETRLTCSGPEPKAWACHLVYPGGVCQEQLTDVPGVTPVGRSPGPPQPVPPAAERIQQIPSGCVGRAARRCPASSGTQLGVTAGFLLSSVAPDCDSCAGFLTRNRSVLGAFPP